jgi:hypothetical protein
MNSHFIRDFVALKTLKTRHRFLKLLSPKTESSLNQLQKIYKYISKTPRPMILAARSHFRKDQLLNGVEIGVQKGDNAISILRELPVQRLFLIDPYVPYEDALGQADSSADYEIAQAKLAGYSQVIWLRKTSESAIREFRNEKAIDFVYIDGNHSYEFVRRDLTLFYPLIKSDGLIGGHDYTPLHETVVKAVNEFAEETGLELHTVFPDWWFIVGDAN